MAILFPEGLNVGNSKKTIFKDGVFKIQPSKNTGNLIDKKLNIKMNQQLLIPYEKSGEMVFMKYIKKNSQGYTFLSTKLNTTKIDYNNASLHGKFVAILNNSMDEPQILGMVSGQYINVTTSFAYADIPSDIEVIEIWTEKLSEGN